MTRQEFIDLLTESVIPMVYRADAKMRPAIKEMIAEHQDDPSTLEEIIYRMIAVEMSTYFTDEDLAKFNNK